MLPADHPYRAAIMDEVHARPVDIIPETCRLRRLVFVTPTEIGATQRVLERFADSAAASARRHHGLVIASMALPRRSGR